MLAHFLFTLQCPPTYPSVPTPLAYYLPPPYLLQSYVKLRSEHKYYVLQTFFCQISPFPIYFPMPPPPKPTRHLPPPPSDVGQEVKCCQLRMMVDLKYLYPKLGRTEKDLKDADVIIIPIE